MTAGEESLFKKFWIWVVGIVLTSIALTLLYAIQFRNWRLAQIASIVAVALFVVSVVMVATTANWLSPQATALTGVVPDTGDERNANRSIWLTRLVLTSAVGMIAIVLYAIQYDHWKLAQVAATASVGFMSAGAAWFVGGLLGFLFGIPHIRQGETAAKKTVSEVNDPPQDTSSPSGTDYEPSTSLEQISDWLTKIIVGVGLTQLNNIPVRLKGLAVYIGSGMGGGHASDAFALGIIVYFSACGFLFGFLWARLYLMEAFRLADIKRAREQLTHQMLDLRAKDLVETNLDLSKPEVAAPLLKDAIGKASTRAKAEIFQRAKEAREAYEFTPAAALRTRPIFRALADEDTGGLYHETHAHLGYVDQDLGEWEKSIENLTRAIESRTRLGRRGWKYYELRRAIARIKLDSGVTPSPPQTRDQIVADLRTAKSDDRQFEKIQKDQEIQAWLSKNSLIL